MAGVCGCVLTFWVCVFPRCVEFDSFICVAFPGERRFYFLGERFGSIGFRFSAKGTLWSFGPVARVACPVTVECAVWAEWTLSSDLDRPSRPPTPPRRQVYAHRYVRRVS